MSEIIEFARSHPLIKTARVISSIYKPGEKMVKLSILNPHERKTLANKAKAGNVTLSQEQMNQLNQDITDVARELETRFQVHTHIATSGSVRNNIWVLDFRPESKAREKTPEEAVKHVNEALEVLRNEGILHFSPLRKK